MKWVNAMHELLEGRKVRHADWEEGKYIRINENGFIVDEKDHLFDMNLINSQIKWVMIDERKKPPFAWSMVYQKLMEGEEFLVKHLNNSYECQKGECFNCIFEEVCDKFYDLYNSLDELNRTYKLDTNEYLDEE